MCLAQERAHSTMTIVPRLEIEPGTPGFKSPTLTIPIIDISNNKQEHKKNEKKNDIMITTEISDILRGLLEDVAVVQMYESIAFQSTESISFIPIHRLASTVAIN